MPGTGGESWSSRPWAEDTVTADCSLSSLLLPESHWKPLGKRVVMWVGLRE